MSSDPAMERFTQDEGELKLTQAKLSQKLDQISELSGEERKAAIQQAESLVEEAKELLGSMRMAKASIPAASKGNVNTRQRNYETDIDGYERKLQNLSTDRSALLGGRYRDDPGADEHYDQRQQLLSGTDRLTRSSARIEQAHRTALETETVGQGILGDLAGQREVIENTHARLQESEGYTDRSLKTLKGMARRMATNRIITIAIITVLVILIIAVIVSKFR